MALFSKTYFPLVLIAFINGLYSSDCAICTDPCDPCCPSTPPNWVITPSAGPFVENGADIYLTGAFTYWSFRQDHMGFAAKNQQVENSASLSSHRGSVTHPDWNFSPGFKVGLGITFDCDGWDLYSNYTWSRVRDTRATTTASNNRQVFDLNWAVLPNNNVFSPSQTGRVFTYEWDISQGKWTLDFDVIDANLGRNFYVSPCLQLRPHFGLKGTWQKQKMDVALMGAPNSTMMFNAFGDYKLKYWGVGIRTGLDSSWHFTPCFSFFGQAAATALYEEFESHVFAYSQNLGTELFTIDANLQDNFNTIKPVLELSIGLRFESWFCCDEYHWSIEAAFEEQWWADQNQFFSTFDETKLGDLVIYGATLKLRFDF